MKKELIGRKVKGFKFEDEKYNNLPYSEAMNDYIGKIGVIKKYYGCDNSYEVQFEKAQFWYPGELIEQHLVSDNPLDSLPMLGEGVLCEVWHGSEYIRAKGFVCARTPYGYVAWASAQEKEHIDYRRIIYWENARPIEPVKQYTKEQLEEILGHKFELI